MKGVWFEILLDLSYVPRSYIDLYVTREAHLLMDDSQRVGNFLNRFG